MILTNETVTHKKLGKGQIIEQDDKYVKVLFDKNKEVKEFQYPGAFGSYIELNNKALMEEIAIIQIKEKEKKLEIVEIEKEELRAKELEKTKNEKNQTRKHTAKNDMSNIAFKCNYCDGGKGNAGVGFEGVCSDETIEYNINVAKHIWCSNDNSDCFRYLNGEINRRELNSIYKEYGSVCYESKMLREWEAFAGYYHNGKNKDKPMTLKKVCSNSLAMLTTRLPYEQESDRIIFAVFLVKENYEGDNTEEGYVKANPNYRIKLSLKEAKKVKFWDYYYNRNKPETIKLGSGLHRYLSDIQAAQVLKKISEIKVDKTEKKLAKEFFEHYCNFKDINNNDIPEPTGALANL